MDKSPGLQKLRIALHLKIYISCSLVFLRQSEGDSPLNNDTISNPAFDKQCLCNDSRDQLQTQQASELTWSDFLTELTRDTFVGTKSTIADKLVVNVTASTGFYLIPMCTEGGDFTNCGKITRFSSHENCYLSEACQSNLQKRKLRVAGVLSKEYAYDTAILQQPNGSYVFEDSFSVELLKCLEIVLNFTTIPIVTTFWGHLLPNNSWTGMIALLLSNDADLGLSSIADRPFRRAVVDFNIPTNEIRLAAFFKKPSSISSETTALFKPFQPEFWVALILLTVGTTFTAYVINGTLNKSSKPDYKVTSKSFLMPQKQNEDLSNSIAWSLMDCVLWSLSTICLQGFYKVPTKVPFRIGMIVGSLSGFVIYSAYAGTLVSFLSVVTEPIQNLGQLLSTDFTFVIVNEPLALKFLAESPDSRNVMVYQRRNTERAYSSMKEAYQKVVKGSFAFVTDHSGAYTSLTDDFTLQEACDIREIAIDNAEQKQGTLVQKNSPYKRVIDFQILRMIQYGLVRRWNLKYLNTKPACDSQSKYEGVEVGSLVIAYVLLGVGILFGLLGLLFEKIQSKLFQRKRISLPISVWSLAN